MSAYTNIPKPTGTPYTLVSPIGKRQYDDASISYDDVNVFYDDIDMNSWINLSKPANIGEIRRGMATGLLMPPTYASGHSISNWIKISKPTT